jgi:nucleoside-diphosphate-sugar epimerase
MRILFTGATSFAGRVLFERLRAAGHEVTAVSRKPIDGPSCQVDLTSPTLADELPRGDFDVLVNFASYVPLAEKTSTWQDCYEQNVVPTGNLLAWAAGRVGRIVHASSCSIYGADKIYTPTDEDHPLRPDTAYALSKYAQEQILNAFARTQQVTVAMLRLGYVYGPGIDPTRAIVRLLEMVRAGKPITLTNGESAGLHLIHVDDIAAVAESMLTMGEGAYNLVSGRHISLREYVETCGRVTGRPVDVTMNDDPEAPITNFYSADRLNRRHGLKTTVSLARGIESLMEAAA